MVKQIKQHKLLATDGNYYSDSSSNSDENEFDNLKKEKEQDQSMEGDKNNFNDHALGENNFNDHALGENNFNDHALGENNFNDQALGENNFNDQALGENNSNNSDSGGSTTISADLDGSNSSNTDANDLDSDDDRLYSTPLLSAIRDNNLAMVEKLLKEGADIEVYHGAGYTPLTLAIKKKNLAIVEILLEYGASPDKNDKYYLGHNSPLSLVVCNASDYFNNPTEDAEIQKERSASLAILNKLIASKAILNTTPSLLSMVWSDSEIQIILLEAGADPDFGRPVGLAVSWSSLKLLNNLIKYGADIHSPFECSKTPLMKAVSGSVMFLEPKIVQTLLENGAKPNIQDAKGNTALTHLVNEIENDSSNLPEKLEMLSLLLKHGAEINTETSEGASAYAGLMLSLLLKHGDEIKTATEGRIDFDKYKEHINIKYEEMGRIYCKHLESVKKEQEQVALTGEITDVLEGEQT